MVTTTKSSTGADAPQATRRLAVGGSLTQAASASTLNITAGFPSAATTGVPASVALKTVPGQVSSGPGWAYNAAHKDVEVTGDGAVLAGLSISGPVQVRASHVTINDVKVVTGGDTAISLWSTAGVTIENSTISGLNTTAGRVGSAIDDRLGNSTGLVVKADNISFFKSAVQVATGLVTGNYIHDPGYITGDHTNGVIADGGTGQLTIRGNTILNNLSQTDAITLDGMTVAGPVANKTITGNLLGGGDYPIYGGTAFGHTTNHIVITNNRFSQAFYPKSGQFGAVAYFDPAAVGNVWTGNVWDTTGLVIPAP